MLSYLISKKLTSVNFSCGGKRIRTADNRRAKAVLYQLSYTPLGHSGFEPETSPLSGVRSNQLS